MNTTLNFDAATVAPSVPFTALPAGDYQVVMSEATTVATKAKDGHFVRVVYTVIEGEFNGRKLFDNMNCWNKSKEACGIAWAQMSAICHAVGRLQVGQMSELFNLPLTITVTVDDDEKYGLSNEVKGFDKPKGAGAPGAPPGGGFSGEDVAPAAPVASLGPTAPATPVAAAPAASPSEAPPWAEAPVAAAAPAAPAAPEALDASAPWNQTEEPVVAATPAPAAPAPAAPAAPAPAAALDAPPWAT